MKTFFIVLLSFSLFIVIFCGVSYGVDGRRENQYQPPPSQHQQPPAPAVSSGPAGVSSTPSPHISVPSFTANPIAQAPGQSTMIVHQSAVVGMQNTFGEVIDKGIEEDGTSWLKVEDKLFGSVSKIKVDKNTKIPIAKQGGAASFNDIKIGDTVGILFSPEGDGIFTGIFSTDVDQQNNIASSIHIFTEQELEAMKQTAESEGLVTIEEDVEPIFQLEEETYLKEEKQTIQPSKKEPQKTQQPKEKRGFFDRWLDRTRNK